MNTPAAWSASQLAAALDDAAPRHERKAAIREAKKRRLTGEWGNWVQGDVQPGALGEGWMGFVTGAYSNAVFTVLVRLLPNGCAHLAISSPTAQPVQRREADRIRREIVGEESALLDVIGPDAEDGFDHLWVAPRALVDRLGLHL